MRREWLMVLLVVVLLGSVGCGTTAKAAAIAEEESGQSKSPTTSETYEVQSGDTLMGISRKLFNGDPQYWDEIADLNDIKAPDYTIYPGQELKLPKPEEKEQGTPTVTDEGGLSDSATQKVQVKEPVSENKRPKAVIKGPASGAVGETLRFNAADSTDEDGRIVSYDWDFGDGTTGSGVNVTHSYGEEGSYQVTLTVTDDGKETDQAKAPTEAVPAAKTYQVQSGDTLMEISRKLFNGDPQYWDEIAELNGIKAPYTLYPGDELKVPEK
ncbi:MAG: PKD domain-containing protein [Anaerolineae bacterium]